MPVNSQSMKHIPQSHIEIRAGNTKFEQIHPLLSRVSKLAQN